MTAPVKVERLASLCAQLLSASAFRRPTTWRNAVIVLTPGERAVSSRGQFAAYLREHDLPELAHECTARKVPPSGCVLVFGLIDSKEVAGATFGVVDIGRGVVHGKSAASPRISFQGDVQSHPRQTMITRRETRALK